VTTDVKHMADSIRVAIVVRTLTCGGAETITLNLGRYLHARGYEVDIVTTSTPGEWFDRIAPAGLGARHIEGRFRSHPVAHAHRVGRALRDGRYDVVMISNSERFAQASMDMLGGDTIVIPWIHCESSDAYRHGLRGQRAWNVAVGCGPKVARVAQSRTRKHVLCIANGLEYPSDDRFAGRREFTEPVRLVFLGRLDDKSKGVLLLPDILDACLKRQVNCTLTVIGAGPDREALEASVVRSGLGEHIDMVGALERDAVDERLLDSHILLMPSRYEGLPCVPLEAQGCGCVPVASRLVGIMDTVVADGETGRIVEGEDIDAFADAVVAIAADAALWRRMSRAGREKVLREFSITSMGEGFVKLISDALAGAYTLARGRRAWTPVDLTAFTWREWIPRSIHQLALGDRLRRLFHLAPRSQTPDVDAPARENCHEA